MESPPPSKGRGCFFYGCIISLVLLLVGGLTAFFGARYAIRKLIATYTDAAPTALPPADISAAEIARAQQRWTGFFEAVKTDQRLPPLVLSAADLNALIAGTGANGLSNKLRVRIEGNRVTGQMCLPLPRGPARGRYLNGEVSLQVEWKDGSLAVRPESVTVRGRPLPPWLMGKLREQNLARDLMNNLDAANTLQNLEAVSVTNDAVVIRPKEP